AGRATTITETIPVHNNPFYTWALEKADCKGMGKGGGVTVTDSAIMLNDLAVAYDTNISCTVTNTLVTTRTVKKSSLGNNTPAQGGDEIVYTLTTEVIGRPTTKETVLTDTLGEAVDFEAVTDSGDFYANVFSPPKLVFTLPAGALPGKHTVSYKVRVKNDAKTAIKNNVISDNGYCEDCQTQNPLIQIASGKISDIGDRNPIGAGDDIIYTLRTNISGGATTSPVMLSDTLNDNLEFVSVISPGRFQADTGQPQRPRFTLPKGTPPGTYEVRYKARAKTTATEKIANKVEASAGTCDKCATENPLVYLRINKSSDIGAGGPAQNGDIITYQLSVTVAGGFTLRDTVLTDTLSSGLQFQKVSSPGRFQAATASAPVLRFTLPKGTPAGTHTITYQARVTDDASGKVKNEVKPSEGICETCILENPVTNLTTEKTSSPLPGTPVQREDLIQYTLTARVENGMTTNNLDLTDTLGEGLEFAGVDFYGNFTADVSQAPKVKFTLPKGMMPGNYQVTYSAKVKGDAKNALNNKVVPAAGTCRQCEVKNPLVFVDSVKSSDIAPGKGVQKGDYINYTLKTTIVGGNTSKDTVLTDTLGAGLAFDSVVSSNGFQANTIGAPSLLFTLPQGSSPGGYTITYRAKVTDYATGAVDNKVTSSPGSSCTKCETKTPLANIATEKTVDVKTGTPVQPGDLLTYTLTTTISDAPSTRDLNISDTLADTLAFEGVVSSGAFRPNTAGAPKLQFTLPKGTPPGTYQVSYKARVKLEGKIAAGNKAEPDYGSCDKCETSNPLIEISTLKSSNLGSGKSVQQGDKIVYTLTSTISGGTSTRDLVLTDSINAALKFTGVKSAGAFKADV
ncbi:MAG: isopeptide-forming domain-containing fimbrial protein, partial [Halothiobacillaceae bacterium]|nr:isopeptide-forming domain-containing fimbrial protein [Halothiobacillaceae bacterium]